MEQDHKLHEIRARLQPERFLAPRVENGQQRGNAECQGVRVETVVQRVVAIGPAELTSM